MGFDWENILDASGAGLADAYDDAVSTVVYDDDPRATEQTPIVDGN